MPACGRPGRALPLGRPGLAGLGRASAGCRTGVARVRDRARHAVLAAPGSGAPGSGRGFLRLLRLVFVRLPPRTVATRSRHPSHEPPSPVSAASASVLHCANRAVGIRAVRRRRRRAGRSWGGPWPRARTPAEPRRASARPSGRSYAARADRGRCVSTRRRRSAHGRRARRESAHEAEQRGGSAGPRTANRGRQRTYRPPTLP
jgi:hypothetical protein